MKSGFTYYRQPNVTAIAPLRGPTSGLTLVTLALDQALHPDLLNSTSCRFGGAGDDLPFVHSRPVLARLSPTAQIADGVLQCAAPPANLTGALGVMRFDFGSEIDHIGVLMGHARLVADHARPCALGTQFSCGGRAADGYTSASSAQCEWLCPIRDGHLRLTNGGYDSSGSFLLATPNTSLSPPPREFNVSFELFVGRHISREQHPYGDGQFTFNFGALYAVDGHFGLTGAAKARATAVEGDRRGLF